MTDDITPGEHMHIYIRDALLLLMEAAKLSEEIEAGYYTLVLGEAIHLLGDL